MSRALGPADLWPIYGRHAAAIFRHGPRPEGAAGPGWSIALSGAGHVDLNQVAFYGPAARVDLDVALARAVAADVPVLLAESAALGLEVGELLEGAGFVRSPGEEALFWAPGVPPPTPSAFEVRRAESRADLEGIWSIFVDVHGYERDLVESMYGDALLDDPVVTPWLVLDAGEPVSCAFVTSIERTLGLFDVMTPSRHRRRGRLERCWAPHSRPPPPSMRAESTESCSGRRPPAGRCTTRSDSASPTW